MQELRIEGFVGKNPEIKESNGKQYAVFSVSCSSKTNRVNADGTPVYESTWYSVFATPEDIAGVKKGSRVMVIGKPRYSMYVANSGEHKMDISLSFTRVFLSAYVSKKQGQENQPLRTNEAQQQLVNQQPKIRQEENSNDSIIEDDGSDLPF